MNDLGDNSGSREPSQSPLSRPDGFDPGRTGLPWQLRLEANAVDVLQHPNISAVMRAAADYIDKLEREIDAMDGDARECGYFD